MLCCSVTLALYDVTIVPVTTQSRVSAGLPSPTLCWTSSLVSVCQLADGDTFSRTAISDLSHGSQNRVVTIGQTQDTESSPQVQLARS